MIQSAEKARTTYYLLLTACAFAWALALSDGRTEIEDGALEELRAIERVIFPLRDPRAPWRLDASRVGSPDCRREFQEAQPAFWDALRGDTLSITVAGDTAWARQVAIADSAAPHEGWTVRQVRQAVEQNAGGACRAPDLGTVRAVATAAVRSCPACTAHAALLSVRGTPDSAQLVLRWRATERLRAIDTTAVIPFETEGLFRREGLYGYLRLRQPDWFSGSILGRDDRDSVGIFPNLAAFGPAVDTLAVRGARRHVAERRREKLRQTNLLGITIDEQLARYAVPLVILGLVLYLGNGLDHAGRVARWSSAEAATLRTFPWVLLSHHACIQPVAAFLLALLPPLTVAALQARLTHVSLASYRGAMAGMAAWSVAVLLASLWTSGKLRELVRLRPRL